MAVLNHADQMPEFSGDLNEWLSSHLQYPDVARKHNKQGKVIVRFIVREDGTIADATVAKSSAVAVLDAEALRVIQAMPLWKPGMQSGKRVKVYYNLPISFTLEG